MLTLDEAKRWLGVSGTDNDVLLTQLITAADKDLKAKVGDYDKSSELAKLYMQFWVGNLYADRFGELNNKEGSAVKQAMDNILFELRLLTEAEKDEDDNA